MGLAVDAEDLPVLQDDRGVEEDVALAQWEADDDGHGLLQGHLAERGHARAVEELTGGPGFLPVQEAVTRRRELGEHHQLCSPIGGFANRGDEPIGRRRLGDVGRDLRRGHADVTGAGAGLGPGVSRPRWRY